jgi:hypothetical protein
MQVKIIETGVEETLCAVDAASGCDWTRDLIGNYDAFNDGQFSEIDDSGVYLCSQATYDWWSAVIDNLNKADEMVLEAKDRDLWSDEVERDYQEIGNMDLDDQAAACVDFLQNLLAGDA